VATLIVVILGLLGIRWAIGLEGNDVESPTISFPSDAIAHLPAKETVAAPSAVRGDEVKFTYSNRTDNDLKLLFFSCEKYYHPGVPPREPWYEANLPRKSDEYISRFGSSSGWYVFYVRREDKADWQYIGTFDLFSYRRPHLTIRLRNGWLGRFGNLYDASFTELTE
jgi:hypothetical protein